MTDLEEKAKEYFVKDCVEYDEDEYICENFEKAIKDAYKKGFNAGAEEIENAHQEEIENLYKSYADRLNQLQKKYDELNDFSNSQCAKLLKENAKLKELLSEEIIDNALLNYIESFSLSMLPQSVEYLEYAEKLKNKATEILRKIRSLKNE